MLMMTLSWMNVSFAQSSNINVCEVSWNDGVVGWWFVYYHTRWVCCQVAKPRIGENHPARVSADVTLNLNLRPEIKREWESEWELVSSYIVCV